VHVEVVTPPDAVSGLSWVVPLAVERRERFKELWLDPSGPAGKLVAPLESAGIVVRKVKAAELVQACGQFVDAVHGGGVAHLDQPVLNRAVTVAAKRDSGDGNFKFSRTKSKGDIGPLVAAAVARFAALSTDDTSIYEGRGLVTLG
jgi:hypothetical protein